MDQSKEARKKRARRMQRVSLKPGAPDQKNPKNHEAIFVSKEVWLVPSAQWRKRPSDSHTISIRLGDLEMRLLKLADRKGMTKHAMMKEAIRRYVDRLEAEERLAETAPPDDEAAGEAALAVYRDVIPGCGLTRIMAAAIARGINPLRAVRAGRGFTVERVAARLDDFGLHIDEKLLVKIEEGTMAPTPKLLAALAQALGVTPGDLQG